MSQELSTEISPEIINSLILTGDMSKLSPTQQTQYYTAICKTLGLNPLTQPFAIITLQGKKTMYALKGCTQQLCDTRKISTEVKNRETKDSVYIVSARATMPEGRYTDDDGIVGISGLKGVELANAMMKAVTKAKRRAVLALCGLGMPDETEIDDIPRDTVQSDPTKSRVENIIEAQASEVKHDKDNNNNQSPEKQEAAIATDNGTTKSSVKESKPKETKNSGEKSDKSPKDVLPEGHHQIQGFILTPAKYSEIGEAKTPKWIFIMDDLKLGTFEKKMFEDISAVLDIQSGMQKDNPEARILLNIEYKERKSGDKILKDIVSFKQVTAQEVLI